MSSRTHKMIEHLARTAFDAGFHGDQDDEDRDTAYRAMETAQRMLLARTDAMELALRALVIHLETLHELIGE